MSEQNFTLYVDSLLLSPYVFSVFVTLTEKKIPFVMLPVNLKTKEHRLPDYAEISMTCRVPTLDHNGFRLAESSAISEYLEELYPGPQYPGVYPVDLSARAQARQIQAWLRSDFVELRTERSTEVVFQGRKNPSSLSEKARYSADKLFAALDRLLKSNASHLFGEWSIADTDCALMLNRLVMNEDNVPKRLASYAREQWARPSVQRWVKMKRSSSPEHFMANRKT